MVTPRPWTYRPPTNRFEAWRARHFPPWLLRVWPIRLGTAVELRYDPHCQASRIYYLKPRCPR